MAPHGVDKMPRVLRLVGRGGGDEKTAILRKSSSSKSTSTSSSTLKIKYSPPSSSLIFRGFRFDGRRWIFRLHHHRGSSSLLTRRSTVSSLSPSRSLRLPRDFDMVQQSIWDNSSRQQQPPQNPRASLTGYINPHTTRFRRSPTWLRTTTSPTTVSLN